MGTATKEAITSSGHDACSAALMSSEGDIAGLADAAQPLLSHRDNTLHPQFFLASIVAAEWAPRVVGIRRSDRVVGILYAKEKRFAGIPTGIIYADASLGKMIVAEPLDFEEVLCAGVTALLKKPGIRGIRILVPACGFELPILQRLAASLAVDSCWVEAKNHSSLTLPSSYDLFLRSLGYHTRQDFRRYRRRSEAADHKFIENLSLAEYEQAASQVLTSCAMKSNSHGIERAVRILSIVDRPLLAGLRHSNGEWLSVFGGWYESDRFIVLSQLNSDETYARAQPSMVLRGYVIEMLIDNGVRSVLFWGGLGGPLMRYSNYIRSIALHLDTRKWSWRALRHAFQIARPVLPRQMSAEADWVVPRTSRILSRPEQTNAQVRP